MLGVANVKKAETGKRGKGAEMTKKPEAKAGYEESEVWEYYARVPVIRSRTWRKCKNIRPG